jgi:replicative DNA helicase
MSQLLEVSTSFTDLDDMTSGLQQRDFVIDTGCPSIGKTSLAMNIVEHTIIKGKMPVLVFSM